ncbi:MAG: NBR1-Ig-like domain-containing protein [Pelolinea sp.]|nr:NBR1-Ig-like domain-containing protein [Pelolinea sp.]
MKRSTLLITIFLLGSIVLGGCQLFFVDTDAIIATRVAEAIDARFAEMEAEDFDKVSESAAPAQPTYTPYPTNTPYPTQVPQTYYAYDYSYVIGTPGGCLNAIFISETVPDNTIYSPGDGFIKSWTIKNTGYCNWNTNYRLVLLSGSAMGGDTFSYLSDTVSPGESVTLTANLTAPSSTGTYRGEWRVQSDLGVNFARFWVQIVVK